MEIEELIRENERRRARMEADFDPVTGRGSTGARRELVIGDFVMERQWVPEGMWGVGLVRELRRWGSIERFLREGLGVEPTEVERRKVSEQLIRLRCKHDFAFWAATLVKIHNKDAGKDVLFRLRYPQRILVELLEGKRLAGEFLWVGNFC